MGYRLREQERVKFVINIFEADTEADLPPASVANNGDKAVTVDTGDLYIRDGRQWVQVGGTSAASTSTTSVARTMALMGG